MRESLSRPNTCPLSESSKSSPSVAFLFPLSLFCLPEKKIKKIKICRLFCSVGPLLHQFSQARESLEAYVVKMLRHVEENDKGWEESEMVCQGKHLSGAFSMKAVHLETLERKAGQRGTKWTPPTF